MRNFTLEDIKKQFPEPREYSKSDILGSCYCVGGALAMYLENINPISQPELIRFPSESSLRVTIQKFNPSIPYAMVEYLAEGIIERSDNGHFDLAWSLVNEILKYPRG